MSQAFKPINLGGVNCYLFQTDQGGFILIDCGMPTMLAELEKGLASAGCHPGNLQLE